MVICNNYLFTSSHSLIKVNMNVRVCQSLVPVTDDRWPDHWCSSCEFKSSSCSFSSPDKLEKLCQQIVGLPGSLSGLSHHNPGWHGMVKYPFKVERESLNRSIRFTELFGMRYSCKHREVISNTPCRWAFITDICLVKKGKSSSLNTSCHLCDQISGAVVVVQNYVLLCHLFVNETTKI